MPCIFYEGILLSKGGRKFISVEKPKEVEYEIKYLSLSLFFPFVSENFKEMNFKRSERESPEYFERAS